MGKKIADVVVVQRSLINLAINNTTAPLCLDENELKLTMTNNNTSNTLLIFFTDNKTNYGITSFGVSVTTLEEVFLKVGEGESLSGVDEE